MFKSFRNRFGRFWRPAISTTSVVVLLGAGAERMRRSSGEDNNVSNVFPSFSPSAQKQQQQAEEGDTRSTGFHNISAAAAAAASYATEESVPSNANRTIRISPFATSPTTPNTTTATSSGSSSSSSSNKDKNKMGGKPNKMNPAAEDMEERLTTAADEPANRQLSGTAAALGSELAQSLKANDEVVDHFIAFLTNSFIHPSAVSAFKDTFVHEFTNNPATMKAFRKFIVDDIINDPDVKPQLIQLSKEVGMRLISEPEIWPRDTLKILKEASLEGLQDPEFKNEALSTIKTNILS